VENGLDFVVSTDGMKCVSIAIGQSINVERPLIVARLEPIEFPKLIARRLTLGAFTIERASHQGLFRVVADEIG
jgi:hypothetical protein